MKIAITGVTGHVGANLLPALCENGYEVTAIYRDDRKIKYFEEFECNKIKGDILDEEFLLKALKDIDVVIHLAAKISINGDPDGSVMATNVDGVKNIVNACLKNNVKKLIHFSSIHAMKYTSDTPIVDENSPYADEECFKYDQSKAMGEQIVIDGISQGLDAVILNPTGIIGPNDYFNSLSGIMIKGLINGKLPGIIKGGFDWVDVRDVRKAVMKILINGNASHKYILSGHWVSFKELAEIVCDFAKRKNNVPEFPIWVAKLGLPYFKMLELLLGKPALYSKESLSIIENSNKNYSSALAKKEIGFESRPIEITIFDMVNWLKNEAPMLK